MEVRPVSPRIRHLGFCGPVPGGIRPCRVAAASVSPTAQPNTGFAFAGLLHTARDVKHQRFHGSVEHVSQEQTFAPRIGIALAMRQEHRSSRKATGSSTGKTFQPVPIRPCAFEKRCIPANVCRMQRPPYPTPLGPTLEVTSSSFYAPTCVSCGSIHGWLRSVQHHMGPSFPPGGLRP